MSAKEKKLAALEAQIGELQRTAASVSVGLTPRMLLCIILVQYHAAALLRCRRSCSCVTVLSCTDDEHQTHLPSEEKYFFWFCPASRFRHLGKRVSYTGFRQSIQQCTALRHNFRPYHVPETERFRLSFFSKAFRIGCPGWLLKLSSFLSIIVTLLFIPFIDTT